MTDVAVGEALPSSTTAEEMFGRRCRELREAGKLTQADLARHVEITTSIAGKPIKLDPSAVARLEQATRYAEQMGWCALSAEADCEAAKAHHAYLMRRGGGVPVPG